MLATSAAMTKEMTALEPIRYTAVPDSEKIPAAIIVPSPSANATRKPSVRVRSTTLDHPSPSRGRRHDPHGVVSLTYPPLYEVREKIHRVTDGMFDV